MYEIQILDSAGKKTLTGNDLGGIYPRAEAKPKYHYLDEGHAPRTNAALPAGQWQTLDVSFRPPVRRRRQEGRQRPVRQGSA